MASPTNPPVPGGRDGELIAAALAARAHAYAPYSGFAVGAAVLAADGRLVAGANVENTAYPLGLCAEAAAIAALVSSGARTVIAAAVAAELGSEGTPITPCGGCRQRLAEFAGPATPVLLAGPDGERTRYRLDALLPAAFRLPGSPDAGAQSP